MIKMRTNENHNIQLHAYIYYTFIFAVLRVNHISCCLNLSKFLSITKL